MSPLHRSPHSLIHFTRASISPNSIKGTAQSHLNNSNLIFLIILHLPKISSSYPILVTNSVILNLIYNTHHRSEQREKFSKRDVSSIVICINLPYVMLPHNHHDKNKQKTRRDEREKKKRKNEESKKNIKTRRRRQRRR
jgi:hypothetical protein